MDKNNEKNIPNDLPCDETSSRIVQRLSQEPKTLDDYLFVLSQIKHVFAAIESEPKKAGDQFSL